MTEIGRRKGIGSHLHVLKEGRIDEAEKLAAETSDEERESAEAHSFHFAQRMRRNEFAEALTHAQKAVELRPENPRFHAELGLALIAVGRQFAALEHLNAAIAAPPSYYLLARRYRGMFYAAAERYEAAAADLTIAAEIEPTRAETRIELANALIEIRQFDRAAAELEAAANLGVKQNARWSYTWGRLRYRLRDYIGARDAFALALSAEPNKIEHFAALAAASHHCGDLDHEKKVNQACFKRFPVNERGPRVPEVRVVVLEDVGTNHPFANLPGSSHPYSRGNFIASMPHNRIAYTHAPINSEYSVEAILGVKQFDLVFNNCATGERVELRDQQQQLEWILEQLRLPVINPPKAVAQSTREANAKKFAGAERFIFPHTILIDQATNPSTSMAQILKDLRLPIILRPFISQRGIGATLVHTENELKEKLAKLPFFKLYAIEYHDCKSDEGLFRRYRMAVIDGRLIPVNLDAASNWNVHSSQRRTVNWAEHGFEQEERQFCADPAAALGAPPEEIFGEIIRNTELDVYGFDFGRRRDGLFVVFEINSAMAFNSSIKVSQYPYLLGQRGRIVRMIEELFFTRANQTRCVASIAP